MTGIEKGVLAEIDDELTLIGERIRNLALERVAYLAEREWLPQVGVSLKEDLPREIDMGPEHGGIDYWPESRDGFINGLYLLETNTDNIMRGSSLILSMGGLYRCASFASSRIRTTSLKRIPHWQTRREVPPQAWIKHREIIARELERAEQRGRTASY